jgi:hypothetical protein
LSVTLSNALAGAHAPRRRSGGSVLRVRPDGIVGSVPDVLSYFSVVGLFIVSTHAIDLLSGSFVRPGADIGQEYDRLGDRVSQFADLGSPPRQLHLSVALLSRAMLSNAPRATAPRHPAMPELELMPTQYPGLLRLLPHRVHRLALRQVRAPPARRLGDLPRHVRLHDALAVSCLLAAVHLSRGHHRAGDQPHVSEASPERFALRGAVWRWRWRWRCGGDNGEESR